MGGLCAALCPERGAEPEVGYRALPGAPAAEASFDAVFELREQLGRGSTAQCYACRERETQRDFAVKIIDKRKVSVLYSDLLPQFRREVDILSRLEHRNIIRLERVFESKNSLHVVTELARGGELFEYLVTRPNSVLTEASVSFLIRQCISAVAHMHSRGVIHRDIKLENILLADRPAACVDGDAAQEEQAGTEDAGDFRSIELKMIDFGLAKWFEEKDGVPARRTAKTFFGTVGYIAPEMMRRKAYTQAVDVWALGVVTFVLLCGVFPFDDNKKHAPHRIDYRLHYPSWVKDLSDSAKDLVACLLQVDPAKRITAEQALHHPWVAGHTASPRAVLSSPGRLIGLKSPVISAALGQSLDDGFALGSPRGKAMVSPLRLDADARGDDHALSPRRCNHNTREADLGACAACAGELEGSDNYDTDDDHDEDGSGAGGMGDLASSADSSSSSSLGSPSLMALT